MTTGSEAQVGPQVDVARLLLLRDIGRAFNSSLDLDHIFQLVLEKVTQVLAAEAASLWLIQDNKELFCETAIGPVSHKVRGLRLPWGTGIVGWVSEHAKPVIVSDAQKDKFLSHQVDEDTGFVTRSMICAPMVVRGNCLGAIQIVNKVRNDDLFTKSDLELLVDMATDAAISVENARLYQAESKVKELQALLKISREIVSTLDLDRILKTVVNILSTVVSYERGSIALLEDGTPRLNAISGQQVVDRQDSETRALEEFHRAQAQETGAVRVVAFGDRRVLVLELRDEEGLIGLLALEGKGEFKESQVEIVGILAAQATVAIRNAQLYRQVPTLNIQGLAGIFKGKALSRRRLAVLGGAAALVAALAIVRVPTTLAGSATVLPSDQIKVVATEGGRVVKVLVDEGALVAKGDLLAELDTADLALQRRAAETALAVSRVRSAQLRLMSDQGAISLEEIRARQAEAEIALLDEKLANARLVAPIAGVVVTPRPGEKLGTTLGRGEVLLELANVADMTVDIALPEADVALVAAEQPVALRLLAFPTRQFSGRVALVSPLGTAGPQGPSFAVRARIPNPGTVLRAGMQGTARIEAGRRPLLWTLLRAPVDWLTLAWWRVKP
ncbi:MAG: efflux RND transporter periplasmic adaptor subunit [Candidatus Sericytochromatia bacterium]|nr:efflux RND transporter periplasmic adaptor subunit [Candidatus Tanganyikabacteria bacterium]